MALFGCKAEPSAPFACCDCIHLQHPLTFIGCFLILSVGTVKRWGDDWIVNHGVQIGGRAEKCSINRTKASASC